MKKITYLFLSAFILCSFCACSKQEEPNSTKPVKSPAKPTDVFVNKADKKAEAKKADAVKPEAAKESSSKDKDTGSNPLSFLPDPVAKIGDEKITRAEIEAEFKPIISMMRENGQIDKIPADVWKKEISSAVDSMIATKLLSSVAEANGFKPDAAAADEEFKKMTEKMTPEQVSTTLAKQGLTAEKIKGKISIGMAIQKWIDEKVTSGIKISDEDVEKFYQSNMDQFKKPETVRASHILIRPDPVDPEKEKGMSDEDKKKSAEEMKQKALKKIQDIQEKLKQGEDFAKLATENSACPSKENGGDLGTFPRGKMVGEFEKTAFSMKPGETSDIVETKFGYHIIKLTEKNEAETAPLKDVKLFITDNLKKQKTMEAVQSIIDTEKKNKKVETFIK